MNFVIIFTSLFATMFLTHKVRDFLLRRNLLDRPNERSSHVVPVPRGGGWAVLIVVVPGMFAAALWAHDLTQQAGLLAGVLLLAAISWFDDRGSVSARARLSLHLLAACLGTLCFAPDATLFGGVLPFWLDRAVMVLGWAWFINLYNFMDGIDGITGVETISIATGTCLVMTALGLDDPFVSTLVLLLTGASLGFLAFNWHPAKIFLGDVGSVPLGYLTGFCLVTLALNGHLISALIIPLYYLADSGITITKRALRREKIWQAHRQHFYQQAAAGVGRHDRVVMLIAAANIALIALSVKALTDPWPSLAGAVLVVAMLLGKLHKLGHARTAT